MRAILNRAADEKRDLTPKSRSRWTAPTRTSSSGRKCIAEALKTGVRQDAATTAIRELIETA